MKPLAFTFLPLVVVLAGCSGDDSGSNPSGTGGNSTGGAASGGSSSGGSSSGGSSSGGSSSGGSSSGGTSSGGSSSGGTSSGGSSSGGSSSGGSGGGIQPANDIENLNGQNVTAFPAYVGFATNDYDDVHGFVWTTAGGTHSYSPTGGWNGGGAAHFTPPTSEGYSGLGSFHFSSGVAPTHLSMRWLMKVGPTMGQYGSGNKTLLFVRNPNDSTHHRPMIITRPDPGHANSFVPGACDGTVCQYLVAANNPEPFWPDGNDTFWLGPTGWAEEWVSWEFEADANAGWIRLYITTQDGTFNDSLYVENPMVD
jgi:hypothetical protein